MSQYSKVGSGTDIVTHFSSFQHEGWLKSVHCVRHKALMENPQTFCPEESEAECKASVSAEK